MQVKLTLDQIQEQRRFLLVVALLVTVFALLSLWGTPFLYDRANSGRYLLKVIQAADPALFPQDSVVESLQRFNSLFYNVLAAAFRVTGTPPAQLETVMYGLYIGYQFALFLTLFIFVRRFSDNLWLFIFVAAWAVHQKGAPVGGNSFFAPQLTHASIAFLLGLLALWALLNHKHFGYWVFSGVAILVHSLIGLHLVLITAPVYWYMRRRFTWETLVGGAIFATSVFLYLLYMAPPAMSPEEAMLFLQTKGDMYHISPFDQSWLEWLRAVTVLGLALLAYYTFLRDSEPAGLLTRFVVWGTIMAVLLGMIAVVFEPLRLVQMQPMRLFLWVWFFAQILLIFATVRAFGQGSPAAPLLLGVLLMDIVVSLWILAFIAFGLVYLILSTAAAYYRSSLLPAIDTGARWSVLLLLLGILGGRIMAHLFNLQVDTLLNPAPLILGGLLVMLIPSEVRPGRWQPILLGMMLVVALLSASLYRHNYYAARVDSDWERVQLWSREHTIPQDRFLTTPGTEGNFRTKAFRTTVSEPMSALCWVDPLVCRDNGRMVAQVNTARQDEVWHVATLAELAAQWHVQYILVAGPYDAHIEPIFQSGHYAIFRVP
jgi:hypothetical protein